MDYIKLFSKRAYSYINTSKKYDAVLNNENFHAVKVLNPQKNEKILHICADGVNIKKYIPKDCDLSEVETNPEFTKISGTNLVSPFDLPYPNNSFDKIIILANLHHSSDEERKLMYQEYYRLLKPNGKFILGDVLENSKQAEFLNGFVNKYNPFGHNGKFFSEDDKALMEDVGFKVDTTICQYPWVFNSVAELNNFTYNLFYLQKIEEEKIFDELIKYLDVEIENNIIQWKWQLIYFTCSKP